MFDRKEIVSFDNLDNIFKKDLNNKEKNNLNKIILSKKINNIDKKYILFIANFIYEASNSLEDSLLNDFLEFILDEQINSKIELNITSLLYLICYRINRIKFKEYSDDEYNSIDTADQLIAKLKTIISISTNILYYDKKTFNKLLIRILNSNTSLDSYNFIIDLFKNKKLNTIPIKKEIILSYLFNHNIDYSNNKNFTEIKKNIWNILTNEEILTLSDDNYKRIINLVFKLTNPQLIIFFTIIKHPDLTINKKIILLDYLELMFSKTKEQYYLQRAVNVLETHDVNIFNIVCSKMFTTMDDETFRIQLNKIIASNKPNSYIKVLANEYLDDEKKLFALNLINQGNPTPAINKTKLTDYKDSVAEAAISPLLINIPLEEYIRMLLKINNYCETTEELFREMKINPNKKIDNRIEAIHIAETIANLLYQEEIFSNNLPRLYTTINILLTKKLDRYLIDEIINFVCNPNSLYYTDAEYIRIINLIRHAYNNERLFSIIHNQSLSLYTNGEYIKEYKQEKSYTKQEKASIIRKLFTNDDIPFTSNKRYLFDIADTKDLETIINLTNKLNKDGNYKTNISQIFNNTDAETIDLLIGPKILKIRKFIYQ